LAKPVVDGLEKQVGQGLIRLSVTSAVGRALARTCGVRGVPTLVVVDRQGQPLIRQMGRIYREPVLEAVFAQAPSASAQPE